MFFKKKLNSIHKYKVYSDFVECTLLSRQSKNEVIYNFNAMSFYRIPHNAIELKKTHKDMFRIIIGKIKV